MEPMELVCACANFRRASRAISRMYEAELAAVDLSATQMTIMMILGKAGPRPLPDLSNALAMDRTSLYRALRPLEKRALLRVRPGKDDRAKEALLTKEGERHFAKALPCWERAQQAFVDMFGKEDWQRAKRALTRVVALTT